jgi:MscS family membrane protein
MFGSRTAFSVPNAMGYLIALILVLTAGSVSDAQERMMSSAPPQGAASAPGYLSSENWLIKPIRTDTPRDTLETFAHLKGEFERTYDLYRIDKTEALASRIMLINEKMLALMDLSALPQASRRETGIDTLAYLLDIFNRVELPDFDKVPGDEELGADNALLKWRIPGTPLFIARIEAGQRQGEFLFSSSTVTSAPRFFRSIQYVPQKSATPNTNWHELFPQATGPMIPDSITNHLPPRLRTVWLHTPLWKIIAVTLIAALAVVLILLLHRLINRRKIEHRLQYYLRRIVTPILILAVIATLRDFVAFQINISGSFSTIFDIVTTVLSYIAIIWLLWLIVRTAFEWFIQMRNVPVDSFNAHLWRFGARIIGTIVSLIIIGKAAHTLGLPLYSVVAGLGVGGLAVALAVRPTLENLIGGILLYIDQPIRVGDWCQFGDKSGTIEEIGVRSTKIRPLDRTLVTIPNAFLADMQLINWGKCDRMLIQSTINLRYETENDQLRYVLVKIREMLHSHPKIHSETIRVRFVEFGASSLDVNIRVFALTRDFNEFYAIREDILLRIHEIVKESGTSFAFPSQTLYLRRDDGVDGERGMAAAEEVKAWRKAGTLPFPRLSADKIEQLKNSLDYPPRGSVESVTPASKTWESSEQLSAKLKDEDGQENKG